MFERWPAIVGDDHTVYVVSSHTQHAISRLRPPRPSPQKCPCRPCLYMGRRPDLSTIHKGVFGIFGVDTRGAIIPKLAQLYHKNHSGSLSSDENSSDHVSTLADVDLGRPSCPVRPFIHHDMLKVTVFQAIICYYYLSHLPSRLRPGTIHKL